jgi:hypothetical protein
VCQSASRSAIARLGSGQTLPSARTLSRYAEATGSKFHVRLAAAWCGAYALIGNDVVQNRKWRAPGDSNSCSRRESVARRGGRTRRAADAGWAAGQLLPSLLGIRGAIKRDGWCGSQQLSGIFVFGELRITIPAGATRLKAGDLLRSLVKEILLTPEAAAVILREP